MPDDQTPEIDWQGGVPVARRFDDPYFSLQDGMGETAHVFLAGNDLPDRFRPGFRIAELGFGTGLNAMAALKFWQDAGITGPLRFTSFERFPMAPSDMARALAEFPGLARLAEPMITAFEAGETEVVTDDMILTLVLGDARTTLPLWAEKADAWFLDGFAPARNPELWESHLLVEVARHTAPEGTIATYTAAGAVRRALGDAGFAVERVPGFAGKRHMTRGKLS